MDDSEPRVGTVRASQRSNCLLVRSDLGKGRRSVYDLPSDYNVNHRYGHRPLSDAVDVAKTLGDWNDGSSSSASAQPGERRASTGQRKKNYIAMNKRAVRDGWTTARGLGEYRAANDVRVKPARLAQPGPKAPKQTAAMEQRFGHSTRPSTPFADVISHGFQTQALDLLLQEQIERDTRAAAFKKKLATQSTKASRGHARRAQGQLADEPEKLFQIARFREAGPKVESHRYGSRATPGVNTNLTYTYV